MLDGFKIYVLIDCIESLSRKRRVLSCDATGWQIFSFLFRTRGVYYGKSLKKSVIASRGKKTRSPMLKVRTVSRILSRLNYRKEKRRMILWVLVAGRNMLHAKSAFFFAYE